jgi:hypothetical protein
VKTEDSNLRKITLEKDVKDLKGWTIPKGSIIYVIKEGPIHPRFGYRILLVKVDNGTGHLELMPETAVRSSEVNHCEIHGCPANDDDGGCRSQLIKSNTCPQRKRALEMRNELGTEKPVCEECGDSDCRGTRGYDCPTYPREER